MTKRLAEKLGAHWRPLSRRSGAIGGSALVATALTAGVLFGNGVARTIVSTSDGTTWVGDDRRGEVVQVNPSTGKPESRLKVGQPGSDLEVQQRDGLLVVIDRRSGVVTVIDLATLLTTGRRQVTPGDSAQVLLDQNRMYLVDRDQGTITNVDPGTARTIGEQWRAPSGLADATVDGKSNLWPLGREGLLYQLNWSDDAARFVERQQRPVNGAGPKSAVVGHDTGATVLGPEGGVVVQVDTGHDRAVAVPGLRTPLHAAETSPADLVPAAVESTGTVVMVRGDEVLEVGVGDVGCGKPGQPAVFTGLVYVPCLGDRKVIALDGDGRRARPDIVTPGGGDPELVVDDGKLLVNVPGADTSVVVGADGGTRTVRTYDPAAKTVDPDNLPASLNIPTTPPSIGPGPSTRKLPSGHDVPASDPPTRASQSTTTTTTRSPEPPPATPDEVRPVSVTAEARSDGSIRVSWGPGAKKPERYRVFRQLGGTDAPLVAEVAGTATSALVTNLAPGTTARFFVLGVPKGYLSGEKLPSSPLSAEVTTFTRPGVPANVRITKKGLMTYQGDLMIGLNIQWDAPSANGSPITGYRLTLRSDTGTAYTADSQSTVVTSIPVPASCNIFPRGCSKEAIQVEVVAINQAGAGEPGRLDTTVKVD